MTFKKIPFWVKKRKPLPGKLDQRRKVVLGKFRQQRATARKANCTTPVDPEQLDIRRVRYAMQLGRDRSAARTTVGREFPALALSIREVGS